jgi:hypothetical protein
VRFPQQEDGLQGQTGKSSYVEGQIVEGVLQVRRIEVFDDYAIPGASAVFVGGTVTAVDGAIGRAFVGSVEIDVTAASQPALHEGDTIAASGTQPVAGGIVLAQTIMVLNEASGNADEILRSISGSSRR